MIDHAKHANLRAGSSRHPFRAAVLRGMGVLLPPLLTILFFLWVITTTKSYLLDPVTAAAREGLVWLWAKDIPEETAAAAPQAYHRLQNGTFVPQAEYEEVRRSPGAEPMPQTREALYRRYVELTYLRPLYAVPFFVAVFVVLLYLLGRFMAAGIGAVFWNLVEQGIRRLPLVRSVYSGVKQVTDFLFTGPEVQFTRIVAVEYPRKGIWSLGFVTGEGLLDIRTVANEPVLTVLVPFSPLPVTATTITVLKRDCIDLNMTIDQALQFIVSCGVVVPPQQLRRLEGPAEALPQPADEGGRR